MSSFLFSSAPWKLNVNLVKGLLLNAALSGMEVWAKAKGPLTPPDVQILESFVVHRCRAILEGACSWASGHAKSPTSQHVLKKFG
eukprot:3489250-Pyramimonas_sp.AAC.1